MNARRFLLLMRATLALAVIVSSLALRAPAQTETVLYSFSGADGNGPIGGLVFDPAGNLYGTTVMGGANDAGTVFKLTPVSGGGWQESVLYSFTEESDGANPWGGLIVDAAGNLFGTTYFGGAWGYGTVFALKPARNGSWTKAVLHSFTGGLDGGIPHAGLIFDTAGTLYGTTFQFGQGYGTVFALTRISGGSWKETVLHTFTDGADGGNPSGALTLDSAGNLYGTTMGGGGASHAGVVFKLSLTSTGRWKESVLHTFTGGADGASPSDRLILDSSGNVYGTTLGGGNLNDCSGFGCGVAFRLTLMPGGGWKESLLHTFSGGADGSYLESGLVIDTWGNLYGTAYYGGNLADCSGAGCGTVFELLPPTSSEGWKERVLATFTGSPIDGGGPSSELIFDASGNLYGTTYGGGTAGDGIVFEIVR